MTAMLAPIKSSTYTSAPTGNQYQSDANGIIGNVPIPADVTALQATGCIVLSPPPTDLLFRLLGANFNTTADQIMSAAMITKWRVKRIVVCNTSVNGMGTAVGGLYTGAGKTGTTIVANTQVYSGLTNALTAVELTLAVASGTILAAQTPLYFSLSTPQGVTATADIYVYGDAYVQ